MAVPPALDEHAGVTDAAPRRRRPRPGAGRGPRRSALVLLGVLVVALLAAAGTLVWLLGGRRGAGPTSSASARP